MRPAPPQGYFDHPLNTLLGTEAAVRVLRELFQHGDVLSVPALSRRTHLTNRGIHLALATLIDGRLVERLGEGRSIAYRVDHSHPLAPLMAQLFAVEAARRHTVLGTARDVAMTLSPPPYGLWLYGSVARGDDTVQSDLDLALCGDASVLTQQVTLLREALAPVAARAAVHLSVVSFTLDEVRAMAAGGARFWAELARDAVVLYGDAPAAMLDRAPTP